MTIREAVNIPAGHDIHELGALGIRQVLKGPRSISSIESNLKMERIIRVSFQPARGPNSWITYERRRAECPVFWWSTGFRICRPSDMLVVEHCIRPRLIRCQNQLERIRLEETRELIKSRLREFKINKSLNKAYGFPGMNRPTTERDIFPSDNHGMPWIKPFCSHDPLSNVPFESLAQLNSKLVHLPDKIRLQPFSK